MVHLAGGGTQPELERNWSEVLRLHAAETARGARPEPPERPFLPAHLARERLDRLPQLFVEEAAGRPVRASFHFRALPPEPIDRDMIVMTGSSITTKFPAPGDRVRFAIDGLGEISLEVAG